VTLLDTSLGKRFTGTFAYIFEKAYYIIPTKLIGAHKPPAEKQHNQHQKCREYHHSQSGDAGDLNKTQAEGLVQKP
jgi:hypothetical protein